MKNKFTNRLRAVSCFLLIVLPLLADCGEEPDPQYDAPAVEIPVEDVAPADPNGDVEWSVGE